MTANFEKAEKPEKPEKPETARAAGKAVRTPPDAATVPGECAGPERRAWGKHPSLRSTITSRGQITVPAWLRRRLGLRPGDHVCFVEREEGFVFGRVESPAALVDWTGYLAKNCPTDHAMRALRADSGSYPRPELDEPSRLRPQPEPGGWSPEPGGSPGPHPEREPGGSHEPDVRVVAGVDADPEPDAWPALPDIGPPAGW